MIKYKYLSFRRNLFLFMVKVYFLWWSMSFLFLISNFVGTLGHTISYVMGFIRDIGFFNISLPHPSHSAKVGHFPATTFGGRSTGFWRTSFYKISPYALPTTVLILMWSSACYSLQEDLGGMMCLKNFLCISKFTLSCQSRFKKLTHSCL